MEVESRIFDTDHLPQRIFSHYGDSTDTVVGAVGVPIQHRWYTAEESPPHAQRNVFRKDKVLQKNRNASHRHGPVPDLNSPKMVKGDKR